VAFHHQFAVAASFDETGMCLNQRLEFWLDDVAVKVKVHDAAHAHRAGSIATDWPRSTPATPLWLVLPELAPLPVVEVEPVLSSTGTSSSLTPELQPAAEVRRGKGQGLRV
jgi:hypothetical protein